MRSFFLSMTSAMMVALFSYASPAFASTAEANKYIDRLAAQTLETIANAKMNKEQKRQRLETLFSRNVDIPWVGKFVMGRNWREATEAQRASYLQSYQDFVIRHYAARFAEYNNGKYKITGSKEDSENEFTVNTEIQSMQNNNPPVLVDYRVRQGKGGLFKIFDISIEGVSMITTQRSEFSSVINSKGIDGLITQLQQKASEIPSGK